MRLSRRKVLQLGSLAPLSAVLLTGRATSAEVAMLAKALPKSVEDDLWKKAKNQNGANEKNFRDASKILVEYFVAGASDSSLTIPDDQYEFMFVDVAYEQPNAQGKKSGDL